MKQQFLITVRRMCVDEDDNSIINEWSAIVAEEDLPNIELALAADLTKVDLPEGLRSMTEEEINIWRRTDG